MTAELLREAAALMRERAEAATPGPVALAVADWLDSVAAASEPGTGRVIVSTDEQAALTVARAYLGKPTP